MPKIRSRRIFLKDSTLREGLDVPGVRFSLRQRLKIAGLLENAGVDEIEIVAPAKVSKDLAFAKKLKKTTGHPETSGLIYAFRPECRQEIKSLGGVLDRIDILMPVSLQRESFSEKEKIKRLLEIMSFALSFPLEVGAGFPHAFQTQPGFLLEIAGKAVRAGARRVTVYDTNGAAVPSEVYELVRRLKQGVRVPVFFHAHNDLGLATANSLAAVHAGADGLDVTVNGLGDRAGNASLEQTALLLQLKGFKTGVRLGTLRRLSRAVEKMSGITVSRLAPVVGEHIFSRISPAHRKHPELFFAFDPRILGCRP